MDGVALASVITSGVLGISIAVWSARQTAKLARKTRTQQRLAESYIEVLRIVEREGQWIEDSIKKWTIAAEPDEFVVNPDRVMVSRPAITDQAVIKAT